MSYSPTTSANIRITTDFGIDTNYGTALTNETIEVNASNYKDAAYQATVVSAGDAQRETITNNDIYKMLNVALPSDLTGTHTATNGITYQYKITASYGTCDLTQCNIIYATTWGIGNYNNTWATTTTLKLTTSNYNTANITTTYRTNQETATKNYLDTLIGQFVAPTEVTETYSDAPSGLTYYIKTTFSGNNVHIDATSKNMTATTTWGTTSGTYDHSFTDGNTNTVTVVPSNYQNRNALIRDIGSTQRTNLKAYLDTLIGTVNTPEDSTTTFSTASGQTFYVKTSFTGSNNTEVATSCTIKYTTVYGLSNSYGNIYSSNLEFVVTPSNYQTWTTDLATTISTEQAKIKNLDTYKMLNVALPGVVTNTNFVATNGITYQYKITPSYGTCDLTQCNIIYTTTWGIGNYNNTWATKTTLKLTTSNYNTANITTTYRTTQVTNTENYLNTLIGNVTTPGNITNTFSTNSGQTFYVKTTATGSNSSITATSCTIKYTTVYGLTDSYSNTLSTNLEFIVTPSNYQTWTTDYASTVSTEQEKIKNLATYKMLNVALPSVVTNTNFVATNGLTYQYKVTPSYGTCNLNYSEINYNTTWGIGYYNNILTTVHTLTLTTSNYSTANITTTNRTIQVTNSEDYLNTLIGTYTAPVAYTETYTNSSSGITYYIKTTYSGSNSNITATSGTLSATTTWGTTSGTYDHSFDDGNTNTVTVIPSNFQNRNALVTDIGDTQRSNLKAYLNTLIGVVSTPGDVTNTFSTNSGQTFYVKTTFTGSNNTEVATSCMIKYTTVYGLNDSYGTTYSSDLEFVVTPSNYQTWTTDLATLVVEEQEKIKTLDSYKMLNVTLPDEYVNDNYVAATNGFTYQYKITASYGTCNLTQCNIGFTTMCGFGNYNSLLSVRRTLTLTTDNYNTPNIVTDALTAQIKATEARLDILIGNVSFQTLYYRVARTTKFSTASDVIFSVSSAYDRSNGGTSYDGPSIVSAFIWYNSTWNGIRLDHTFFNVDASNWSTWDADLTAQMAQVHSKVKNREEYKMLDVALPSTVNGTYIATNGISYQYKITASNGTCDYTQRNIIYTTTWGIDNYNNTWDSTNTASLNLSNYTDDSLYTTPRDTQVTNTRNYFDTLIGTYTAPEAYTETYTAANGLTYYIKSTYIGENTDPTATTGTLSVNTTWGTTSDTYDHSFDDGNTNSITIVPTNFQNRESLIAAIGSTQRTNLKNYLDTLLVTPNDYVSIYIKDECKYLFMIKYTMSDELSHEIIATNYIDQIKLKETKNTYTNMDDFHSKFQALQDTKINEIVNAVSDSPNSHVTTIMNIKLKKSYTKLQGSDGVDSNIYGTITYGDYIVYGPINLGKPTSFTNYKFVYTSLIEPLETEYTKIYNLLLSSTPDIVIGSKSYTYQVSDNIAYKIQYSCTFVNTLKYDLMIKIDDNTVYEDEITLNIREINKPVEKMKYLLYKYENMLKYVGPVDVEENYNGIIISKKFTKNESSDSITCDLYVDGVKKHTYTGIFNPSLVVSNKLFVLKEDLQSLGDGDFEEYAYAAKSFNISVSYTNTITTNDGSDCNVWAYTEKIGSKVRVYRMLDNMKTNYIDINIDYLNISTTNTAIQATARNLVLSFDANTIDFYRPPAERALVELLKPITA